MFPCSTGERWTCWPKLQFDRARKAAGLRGGPHTLRHTFASHFLAGQPDIGLLAQVLGHSEESVTRLYQHMLPSAWRARSLVSIGLPPARGTAQIVNASAVDAQPAQPAGSERDHEKRLPRRLPRAKGPRLASEPLDLLGAGNRIRTGDPQLGKAKNTSRTGPHAAARARNYCIGRQARPAPAAASRSK